MTDIQRGDDDLACGMTWHSESDNQQKKANQQQQEERTAEEISFSHVLCLLFKVLSDQPASGRPTQ